MCLIFKHLNHDTEEKMLFYKLMVLYTIFSKILSSQTSSSDKMA